MDTLLLQQPGEFVFTQSEAPAELAPHEAIVRLGRIGICGTDIHAFRGHPPFLRYPRILGHELGVEGRASGGRLFEEGEDRCSAVDHTSGGPARAAGGVGGWLAPGSGTMKAMVEA